MKTLKHVKPLLVLSIAFALGISYVNTNDHDVTLKVEAATSYVPSEISVPTTLYLKHNSEQEVRDYYKDLNSLPSSELKGFNLLKNLKPILKNNSTYVNYNTVWQTSCITDRDWTRSPASSIPCDSYDPNTMTVTGYKDSFNFKNKDGDDPYLHVLYRNDNGKHNIKINSNHNPLEGVGGINKEHVWPQSRGFKADSGTQPLGPAGTDVHHLIIADAIVNQATHSNIPYGEVTIPSENKPNQKFKVYGDYTNTNETYVIGNYRGTNSISGEGEVFEPIDSDKGDIARAIFYMVARYNNLANESNAISQFESNLTLDNHRHSLSSEISSDTNPVNLSFLKYLYKWHQQDPVDDYEIYRNDLIYNNVQGNRNPFIDFPSWVDLIWDANGENSNPKKAAEPNLDAVSLYGKAPSGGETNPDQGGGQTTPEEGGDGGEVTPPTPPVDPDVKPDSDNSFKQTVEKGCKEFITSASKLQPGKYYLTVEANGSKQYLNSNNLTVSNGKISNLEAFNFNLEGGYFNINKGTSDNSFTISSQDGSKYISYSSGTNLELVSKDAIKNNAEWTASGEDIICFANVNTKERGLLYQISNARFGGYSLTNYGKTDYAGINLYECIYTYDVLLDALKSMTCEQMKDSKFIEKITNLYNKLTKQEKAAFDLQEIVCADKNTYKASYAYQYALNYSKSNTQTLNEYFKNNDVELALIIIVTSVVVTGLCIYAFNVKKRKMNK